MSNDLTIFELEISPRIPPELAALEELANDLRYSWERDVRALFASLDPALWEACGHNPKVFLRRVSQQKLERAAQNRSYMARFSRAVAAARLYEKQEMRDFLSAWLDREEDLIAYFCAEFGLHESIPIYSGGLGILAGDHCKSASDLGIPFVAVGLLYRQGYFTQQIDAHGHQQAIYHTTDLGDLPLRHATDAEGRPLRVTLHPLGRELHLQVWLAKAGHIQLVLLDSDVPENSEEDRNITFRLYGGDQHTRLMQELCLGIGGVRALRALGLAPTVWHINEGHAAFQVLERCREHMAAGHDFPTAWELTAAGTLFTTHTPVPAGHDIFDADMLLHYMGEWPERLGLDREGFLALGRATTETHGFNMTSLALHGSRFHNGVSRIHGQVASRNEAAIWPELDPEENPISYVTNGVHAATFLAMEWQNLFDNRFPDWRNELTNEQFWTKIEELPDHRFWSLRRECKAAMLRDVRRRLVRQYRRNGLRENEIASLTQWLGEKGETALVVGFARRFATYKRATLLFTDMERLGRILTDEERPIIFIFAGKAHPADYPGQELITRIHQHAMNPAWRGKILLVENYDQALARKLVAGVDVWLNNPEYPMEASGTSGEKAAMNGVLNLSVTDGWWAEGYTGDNGWAIHPHDPNLPAHERDQAEANELYCLLEQQVIPTFYDLDDHGYPREWVRMAKRSMQTIIPRFSSERMVVDYIRQFYSVATRHQRRLAADDARLARELGAWKRRVREAWPSVTLELGEAPPQRLLDGSPLVLTALVQLGGLEPQDVRVVCQLGAPDEDGRFVAREDRELIHVGENDQGLAIYSGNIETSLKGLVQYRLRAYPWHDGLAHPFEMGLMRYALRPA